MQAPERIETARLLLRRPLPADAHAIFARYAADPRVTKYVAFPTHRSLADTRAFLARSDAGWAERRSGAYLIESRHDGALLGGTGLILETPFRASTGYVLARDAWGLGYATEALGAIVAAGRDMGLCRLDALCHTDHRASCRVLEKCGFLREGILRRHTEFPNLQPREPCDVFVYARTFR